MGSTANEKAKIFRNLVTEVDKKATVAEQAGHLRDEDQTHKGIKVELEMRKQTLKKRQ